MERTTGKSVVVLPLLALVGGCAGSLESSARTELRQQRQLYTATHQLVGTETSSAAESAAADLEAGLGAYVAFALKHNPEIRAAFERWQGSVYRISRARRLPEPMLSFGYFLRTAESPIAPDQGRIGLQQAFPWPTKLTAGADAASAGARAMQAEFEARALAVSQRVANAYWDLWQLRRTRSIHREHLDVVRSLSQSVRARIASGTAMLADLQQIDLTAARLEDGIRGMDETERAFEARLRETIGLEPHVVVPTPKPPEHAALPSLGADVLREAARSHPMIASRGFMAESADSSARAEAADRLPSFLVGVSWMISADAGMPGGVDFGAGVSLPLWQGSYSDAIEAARADAHAQRAEQQTLVNRAFAELEATLSGVRDAARRVHLYENTLVPQAESAYESVLGAYTVGRGSVAETLLAQRDLLDLRVELDRARADHARSWARLEEVTGRELRGAANHEVKNE